MRKLATAWTTWFALAAVLFIVHAAWMVRSRYGGELARCGAWWVVLAAAVIARPIIRKGYTRWYIDSRGVRGGSYNPTAEEKEENRQSARDAFSVQVVGPGLAIAGTLLWAYGDLAGYLLPRH